MNEFEIHLNYWELLALHKALLEAKFHENPDNQLVSGSPLVAGIYIQVRDLLCQSQKAEDWKLYYQLKNKLYFRAKAIDRMSQDQRWETASDEDRKTIAADYLAPFFFDEKELTEAVQDAWKRRFHRMQGGEGYGSD